MAYKCREEIVGKRFLCVSGLNKPKSSTKIRDWGWRSGVIRAASHRDNKNQDLQVLVEYDDLDWRRREWISVYKEDLFHIFMVEQALMWAHRKDPYTKTHDAVLWPGLTFSALIDKLEIPVHLQPVEFLIDRELTFKDYKTLKMYQEWDASLPGVKDYPELKQAVKRWCEQQDGQRILLTTPSVLVGYRVEVCRAEGTTQWYTAVIIGYNEATRDLTVTDDTVLEEHSEDPSLVQMRLIGDGIVESIMRGEVVGITPRRSRSSALLQHTSQTLPQSRFIRGIPSVTTCNVNSRKPRSTKSSVSESGISPEPPDKGTTGKSRKRKHSDTESAIKPRLFKENVENKQIRRKTLKNRYSNKKKVLEEANNSKLREIEVRVENCLQTNSALSLLCRQKLEERTDRSPNRNDLVTVDESTPTNEAVEALEDSNGSNLSSEDSSVELVGVINDKNEVDVASENVCDESSKPSEEIVIEGGDNIISSKNSTCGSSEEDCVIVAERSETPTNTPVGKAADQEPDYSIRGHDDDVSLPPATTTSPAHISNSRMEVSIIGSVSDPNFSLHHHRATSGSNSNVYQSLQSSDDRCSTDSGVSLSLRSSTGGASSGDERSGSRSSALSSTDETPSVNHFLSSGPTNVSGQTININQSNSLPTLQTRSPLLIPTSSSGSYHQLQRHHEVSSNEPIRVWRDPNLLFEESQIRHIHSVQHQSLMMSHSSTPGATPSSGPSSVVPPTSASSGSGGHPSSIGAYSVVPPPPSLITHPLTGHPHLAPPPHGLYHSQFPTDMLWKSTAAAAASGGQRYGGIPPHIFTAAAAQQSHSVAAVAEEMMAERERVAVLAMQDRDRHERIIRERQNQEIEKQKEKDRIERDKQEREKIERDRQEKERELEKERQEQALQNHFEKSLRAAQQRREQQWNPIAGRPQQSRTSEDDRKRAEEMHQREQQRHMPARPEPRDHRPYFNTVQRPPSVPSKQEYPPPPVAHSRVSSAKQPTTSEKMSPMSMHQSMQVKNELNMYSYPVCPPQSSFFESMKSQANTHSGLVVSKSDGLSNEIKNSVIVKHDAKNTHHSLEPRVSIAHSPSPKLRNDIMSHYQSPSSNQSKGIYEYRSPNQSPHHLASPHHHLDPAQNSNKTQQTPYHKTAGGQLPSPHHQRQSPHQHQHQLAQVHPAADIRYGRTAAENQALIYQSQAKSGYAYTTAYSVSTSPSLSNTKPKVSSPAPHQIFGKPQLGSVSVIPVTRSQHDVSSAPIQLTSKPPLSSSVSPSPYQQVSQYNPHLSHHQSPTITYPPPPAHSSQTKSVPIERYDRSSPGYVPAGLSVKLVGADTSPASSGCAPLSSVRGPFIGQFGQSLSAGNQVQTQPLDLGMSSNKTENSQSNSPKRKSSTPVHQLLEPSNPVCLEVKKRRVEPPSVSGIVNINQPNLTIFSSQQHPQQHQPELSRVSEPSPLIASAATTITTMVNTAAYRTPTASVTPLLTQNTTILSENLPDVSVTTVTVEPVRPLSTGTEQPSPKPPTPTVPQSASPAPASAASTPTPPTSVIPGPSEDPPGTPVKVNLTPSVIDSEKSNSPGPLITASSPCNTITHTHLKKAWLRRHTDQDTTSVVVGSASGVTLPLNIKTMPSVAPSVKENPVNSLHSVGSMAVNSINKTKHFSNKSVNRKVSKESTVNGDAKNVDDSSSSDQDRGRKSPPKRKPPKVKRKKGGGTGLKKAVDEKKRKGGQPIAAAGSESGSDSDKESCSEKDSDSGESNSAPGKKSGSSKEPRKRGRRPKSSKNDKREEPRPKKFKDDNTPPARDPFRKPPISQLKKTGESFLQDGPCFEVAPKLAKCRECRWTPNQRSKNMPNDFCRFFAFRRLRYTKNGQLAIAGFSDPYKDAVEDDLKLWIPNAENPPKDLDLETSRFLLKQVGDHFCDLLIQEKESNAEHMSDDDKTVAWKRVVQGVREMCDVCDTTLFNFHWACGKCGFAVCIDCYKSRKKGTIKVWGEPGKDRDEYSWLLCTNRQAHEQEKLMLTQIIAGDSLLKLGKMVHEMRDLWNIEQYCGCPQSKEVQQKSNNIQAKEVVKMVLGDTVNGIKKEIKQEEEDIFDEEEKKEGSSSDEEENCSTLRKLLIRPSHKANGSRAASPVSSKSEQKKKPAQPTKPADLDDVISSVIEDSVPQKTVETPPTAEPKFELKHFVRRYNWQGKGRIQLPIRIMTLTESQTLYPDTPHSWLCDGKLLRLSDPLCKGNYKMFQDQWKRGQPVIISDVTRTIDGDLWNPESFARDFGDEKNDLVNCMTGNLVPNQPMRKFWEGFDHFSKRLKDDRGQPMLLKLKDWPSGKDFAEMLPSRYSDLMKVLPLSEYTHRTGRLNLASRLPECFVKPDLGPKMYNAYGSALHPNKGTTNLHLDISDAVNVMVYVGIPKDGDINDMMKDACRAIDEAGCDILTRRRVRDKGELPGALWHIYNARDADKIRDLLNKVVVEKGGRLEPHHDPIHDQSCYLDVPLRERLYKEYGVEGYAIVQCKGDAVFIPAGAPHQVKNLHNCIKVAEDFVSPENVSHCFHLTQEFRDLSDTHTNHEDKLQIKNIIYHAVKDSLSTLCSIMNKHIKNEKESSCERSNSTDVDNSTKSDSNETT